MPLYLMDLVVTERHQFTFQAPDQDAADEIADAVVEYGMYEARDLYRPDRDTDVEVVRVKGRGQLHLSAERVEAALDTYSRLEG